MAKGGYRNNRKRLGPTCLLESVSCQMVVAVRECAGRLVVPAVAVIPALTVYRLPHRHLVRLLQGPSNPSATLGLSGCVAPETAATPKAVTESAGAESVETSSASVAQAGAAETEIEVSLMPTPTPEPEVQSTALGAPTDEQQAILANLKNQGAAPELTNDTWINSEPLQLTDLRGNVVIVEFWTYG